MLPPSHTPQWVSGLLVETRVVQVLAVEPELAHAALPADLPPFLGGDGTQLCCACLNNKIPPVFGVFCRRCFGHLHGDGRGGSGVTLPPESARSRHRAWSYPETLSHRGNANWDQSLTGRDHPDLDCELRGGGLVCRLCVHNIQHNEALSSTDY